MIYILDFRGSDVGGAVVPGRILQISRLSVPLGTEDDLRLESKITFLLHGYNVSRQSGIDSLLRLAEHLPSAGDGAIVAVLWPGDHWTRGVSYPFEGNDADDSAAELARYIDLNIRRGTELSFVSHSLGARVVMGTVKRLIDEGYPIGQICLMAAAIDDFSLARPDDYRVAVTSAERVAVLASEKDKVLMIAYPIGDLLQSFIFFRKEKIGLALGRRGPKAFSGNAIPNQVYHLQIPNNRKSDHGDYIPANPPNMEQLSAAQFADEVLKREATPKYL